MVAIASELRVRYLGVVHKSPRCTAVVLVYRRAPARLGIHGVHDVGYSTNEPSAGGDLYGNMLERAISGCWQMVRISDGVADQR